MTDLTRQDLATSCLSSVTCDASPPNGGSFGYGKEMRRERKKEKIKTYASW